MKDDGEEVEDEFTGGLGKVVLQRLLVANRDSSRLKRQRERLGVDVHLLPHEDCDLGGWDAVLFDPRSDAVGTVSSLLAARRLLDHLDDSLIAEQVILSHRRSRLHDLDHLVLKATEPRRRPKVRVEVARLSRERSEEHTS